MSEENKILLVDDEYEVIQGFEFILQSEGFAGAIGCQDSRDVLTMIGSEDISLVLLDLSMPNVSGEQLLPLIVEQYPDLPVVIVTGLNDLETAVRCIKAGAFDYLVKPVEPTKLITTVRRAIEMRELRMEYASFKNRVLTNKLDHPECFSAMVTANSGMHAVFQYAETIAITSRPVLITGDTGVGKELLARAVHKLSGRRGPFVAVNVAGLDDNMFSDTLFGHVKGAFTGAEKVRAGLVEQAAGGTLFLDEIGDMELTSQVKLLRLLQEKEYYPLGADAAKLSEVRIVVATNRDLQQLQKKGGFRTDLYYRLQTHHINIPPLRQRIDDIPMLVDYFLDKAAESLNKKKPTVPRELFTLLAAYRFPGNVRELESMVFDAMSHHKERMLSCGRFRDHITRHSDQPVDVHGDQVDANMESGSSLFALFDRLPTLSEVPGMLIAEAMSRADGNQTVAAQLLGITRSGLSKALKRQGVAVSGGQ